MPPLEEDIPMADINRIRLQLSGSMASITLNYAALALGILVLWGTILHDAEPVGDGNYIWVIEGILLAGAAHAVLNSAFYGRLTGLVHAMVPERGLEDEEDRSLDYSKRPDDYLSRLFFRYMRETKKIWWLSPFGNVFSFKLILFVAAGVILGLVLAFI